VRAPRSAVERIVGIIFIGFLLLDYLYNIP